MKNSSLLILVPKVAPSRGDFVCYVGADLFFFAKQNAFRCKGLHVLLVLVARQNRMWSWFQYYIRRCDPLSKWSRLLLASAPFLRYRRPSILWQSSRISDTAQCSSTPSPAQAPENHAASVVCVQCLSHLATLPLAATVHFDQSSQFDARCFGWKVNFRSCLENPRKTFLRNNSLITRVIFFLFGGASSFSANWREQRISRALGISLEGGINISGVNRGQH